MAEEGVRTFFTVYGYRCWPETDSPVDVRRHLYGCNAIADLDTQAAYDLAVALAKGKPVEVI